VASWAICSKCTSRFIHSRYFIVQALPPSVIAGHAAIETYSTDAVLEVHPSWPLLGREPDPAMLREPHPAPTPALALLPDNSAPASKHPADPVFTRSPAFTGTKVGATTSHFAPVLVSCQYST
jgi:hypothetical protein